MAPSRGALGTSIANADSHDDIAVNQQSSSALANARRNFKYLLNPTKAGERPARVWTRALLRTVRYIGQFIIWRLIRWAKYAAVGALVAAISASAIGGLVTGAAWVVAPPTFGASIIAASIWGTGKFAARRLHKRWEATGKDEGTAHREQQEGNPLRNNGQYGTEMGPQAVPW